MICPLCLRDVRQLVGPERICIDCYAFLEDDAEDFEEEPFSDLYDEGASPSGIPDYVEDLIPGLLFGGAGSALDAEEDWSSIPAEDGDEGTEDVPTFGGRPRF